MARNTANVFVALSGGVDSSAAAALLHHNGLNCAAVFMITSDRLRNAQANAEKIANARPISSFLSPAGA
jgi:tRNA U34 2-thiouridine synthase MnmA/TrmU